MRLNMSTDRSVFKAYDYIESRAMIPIELTVGEYLEIDVKPYRYERVYTVTYEGLPEDAPIAIAEILSPQTVMIVSSAPPGSEWIGKQIKCTAYVSGLSFYKRDNRIVVIPPFWYFLLTEAIRLINDGENNLTIVISTTAFESFISEFIAIKLHKNGAWSGLTTDQELDRFKDKFLAGPESLDMNDKISIFIKAWLGIQFTEETYNDWNDNVRSRRNVLVHALSRRQYSNVDAIKAFRATCRFIYEILTLDGDEELLKNSYLDDLKHFLEAADDSLSTLEEVET